MKRTVAIPAKYLDAVTGQIRAGYDQQTLDALLDYDPQTLSEDELTKRLAEIAKLEGILADLAKYGDIDLTPDEVAAIEQEAADLAAAELAERPQRLNGHLDKVRYDTEQGGIVVAGITILTRDRDKTLINGKITQVLVLGLPDTDTFNFTLDGQEITMTVGQIKAIGVAIAQHVQNCIDAASAVRPSIANGTITTEQQVEDAFAAALQALLS